MSMWLSAKTNNACLAMMELAARHSSPNPISLKTIADEQKVSPQFLVQILLQLKRGGLVQSTRGASGGYRLTRDPREITLLDIVQAMNGVQEGNAPAADASTAASVLHETWLDVLDQHLQRLSATTLSDLAGQVSAVIEVEDMYHI